MKLLGAKFANVGFSLGGKRIPVLLSAIWKLLANEILACMWPGQLSWWGMLFRTNLRAIFSLRLQMGLHIACQKSCGLHFSRQSCPVQVKLPKSQSWGEVGTEHEMMQQLSSRACSGGLGGSVKAFLLSSLCCAYFFVFTCALAWDFKSSWSIRGRKISFLLSAGGQKGMGKVRLCPVNWLLTSTA